MEKLRVIQWTTGRIGKQSLRAILDDPRLDLAGVYAWSADKAGQDAGALCGRSECGVTSSSDIEALVALGADAVLYTPFVADLDQVVRLLETGHDVISTNLFNNLGGVQGEVRERLDDACRRGQSSFFITGVNPGWINATVAGLSAVCRKVESVTVDESADCRQYDSADTWLALGLSLPEATPDVIATARGALTSFHDSTRRMADALAFDVEEMEFFIDFAHAARDVDLGWFKMAQGTIAALRGGWNAKVAGRTVVRTTVAWYLTPELEEQWEFDDDHYHVMIKGEPDIDVRIHFIAPRWENQDWDSLTALPAVNAVTNVRRARPGVLTLADVGLVTAPAGLWPR